MTKQSLQPHIRLSENSQFGRVLVCGSPERAEMISSRLEGGTLIAKNREYSSYLGKRYGRDILVTSHGIGAAGAMICFQELINVGAKVIIRLGTAGGLYDETQVGDVVVPNSAIRQDGVTALMVPPSYAATPDPSLAMTLQEKLLVCQLPVRSGKVLTSDLFYPGLLEPGLQSAKDNNAIAVEMECSALFVVGLLRKVKTAAALVLDGNPLRWKDGCYNPHSEQMKTSMSLCMDACLDALADQAV